MKIKFKNIFSAFKNAAKEWVVEVMVKVSVANIKNSPEYAADQQLTEDYITNLHNYFEKMVSRKQEANI